MVAALRDFVVLLASLAFLAWHYGPLLVGLLGGG